MLRQMLVAVEFSVCSRHAAQHACDAARATGGHITLLHVLEAHESGPQGLHAAHTLLDELGQLARRPPECLIVPARRRLGGQGPGMDDGPGAGGVEDGVALAILAVADQLDVDLIVIGLHGQGNPTAMTLGRVVQQVMLDARVPVQVVPCHVRVLTADRWGGLLGRMINR